MKESPKPQLKFFHYKEASTFSWEKRKENGSLKLFPNLYKKEGKKLRMKENAHQSTFTVKYILVQGHVVQPLICPTCRNAMYKIQYHSI